MHESQATCPALGAFYHWGGQCGQHPAPASPYNAQGGLKKDEAKTFQRGYGVVKLWSCECGLEVPKHYIESV